MRNRNMTASRVDTALGWRIDFSGNWVLRAALIIFVLMIFAGPFVTTISGAFDANVTARTISVWPSEPTLDNFVRAADVGVWDYLLRSLVIAGGGLLLQIVSSVLVAFAVSMLEIPGRRIVMALMLATIMVPEELIAVPLSLVLRDVPVFGVNLIGSIWGVILPLAAWGFSVLLMAEFMRELPRELIEAAKLDGVGPIRMLWTIVLPLCVPALGVITIFGFQMIWDQYLLPLIAADSPDDFTLTVALRTLGTTGDSDIGITLAGSFLALIPSLIVYMLLQRSMIRGLTSGALK